jgi:hypothetical protein
MELALKNVNNVILFDPCKWQNYAIEQRLTKINRDICKELE